MDPNGSKMGRASQPERGHAVSHAHILVKAPQGPKGHQVLGTWYLVPSTWYQVLGTEYWVPSTWYQALGTKHLVPSTWYQVRGTGNNQQETQGTLAQHKRFLGISSVCIRHHTGIQTSYRYTDILHVYRHPTSIQALCMQVYRHPVGIQASCRYTGKSFRGVRLY